MTRSIDNERQRIHPAVWDMQSELRQEKVSRREFLRMATLLGTSLATANVLVACGGSVAPPTPSPMPIKRGGSMNIGTSIQAIDHPARLAWTEIANQLRQVAEYLTETGADNITRPWLLERWEADEEVKTWTLILRRGITFNNGQELTADDVIFNFKQWLDPSVGSSMASLMSYLVRNNIERVDDWTIRLHLSEPQIGVPEHLFHYPAMILPRTFEGDFLKQPIGTGPFRLVEFTLDERVLLKRRSDYWRMGADGKPLPYLDELHYIALSPDERVAAMQGGVIDTLFLPRPEDWQALKDVPGMSVYDVSSPRSSVLRMRVDQEPWNDVRVRQALKLCQNRPQILERPLFGEGDLAIDAHLAPIHPAYCEKPIPDYDPERARALLAEAGYPNGLSVKLTTKNSQEEPLIARMLQKQAAKAGFEIEVNLVEPAKYWQQWTEVNLGITSWIHRPLGTMGLALAYTADKDGTPAPWNETR